jgi:ERCC4-related helicase
VELLEKAKRKNIIVYLGTGSGKTFIAVMLIKHLRQRLGPAHKVLQVLSSVMYCRLSCRPSSW